MDLDQAKQYLRSIGITFPDFVILAIIEQMEEQKECLESNYSKSTITLILLFTCINRWRSIRNVYQAMQYLALLVSLSRTKIALRFLTVNLLYLESLISITAWEV